MYFFELFPSPSGVDETQIKSLYAVTQPLDVTCASKVNKYLKIL